MLGEQLLGVRLVAEDVLHAGLAVVEVAAHAPDLHVVAGGRDHLLALDVAHAAIGEQHADAHVLGVLEAFERGLTRVARSCHQDEEVVVELPALAKRLGACREEAGQALQCHVLERARGAMPQLEHVGVLIERGDRADALVVKLVAVSALHERFDALGRQVDAEGAVNRGSALGVGHLRQAANLVDRKCRHVSGDVEAASMCQAVNDRLREGDGVAHEAACVGIEVLVYACSRGEAVFHIATFRVQISHAYYTICENILKGNYPQFLQFNYYRTPCFGAWL